MSRGRGGRRKKPEEGHGGEERWMASYMDMVTVLMCLFIVLYAMSTVDTAKFEKLKASLATGFGVEQSQTVDTAEGVIVPPEDAGQKGLLTNQDVAQDTREHLMKIAEAEKADLEALRRKIEKRLAATGHRGAADFTVDQRGLTIRLVSAETFFKPNSADLTANASEVLEAIAPVLAPTKRSFEVEGFADVVKPVDPYPTNWELSASRATRVLRSLVEDGGVRGNKIASVGYGDARPVPGKKNLALNRRVDVVVLSDQPENVRSLLPSVVPRS
ncbi:OmpA/MotB family protein [Arthrobacter sp.]|uniref:OmpA/MotB family protein n=1 Tax=Arthrobacter sp. TaxID=1667 RepID=UPI003A8DBC1F